MYAEVAINAPVKNTFHYHVPPDLKGKIQPGHLVQVAFGTALQHGIVAALTPDSPVEATKPLLARLDPQPVVTEKQIELARRLSDLYLAPIGQCLWLMLPPGLTGQRDILVTLRHADAEIIDPLAQRIVALLRRRGPLRGHHLNLALAAEPWRASLEVLVKQGIVEKESILTPPRLRPKIVRTAALAIHPKHIASVARHLGHESRRANVLEIIAALPSEQPTVAQVLQAAATTEAPLHKLADLGLVTLHAREYYYELTQPAGTVLETLDTDNGYALTAKQSDALRQVAEAGGVVQPGVIGNTRLRPLIDKGLIRRVEQVATVSLNIPRYTVDDKLVDLRKGQKFVHILNVLSRESEPMDVSWLYAQTGANLADLRRLEEEGLILLGEKQTWRDSLAERDFVPTVAPAFTREQEAVWKKISEHIKKWNWQDTKAKTASTANGKRNAGLFLLHGVTGSGKTEIYLRAIEMVLAQGRQAIFLVPEIALTPQTVRRVAARFPGQVAIVHSGLSEGERYDTWRRAREGLIQVVVGARSALFTPLPDVGLVIVDEEHDDSYKQSPPFAQPYYHTRQVAEEMMRQNHGTLILGSATPDVETMFRALRNDLQLLRLPNRIMGHRMRILEQAEREGVVARYRPTSAEDALMIDLPPVHVVDMRNELKAGNTSIFSRELQAGLAAVLERREQAILFLNRRGSASYVFCRDCGYVASCPRCDTPLTYHQQDEMLYCHRCGYQQPEPTECPVCQSNRIKFFGAGTQQVEAALHQMFPQARVMRWDADTADKPHMHEALLLRFIERKADIMVGTQMIAKGLDLPLVTLVGVVSADMGLALPDFRSGERTFQLLTQVAGRAGRGLLGGQVVLQTYQPDHYAILAAAKHDYQGFYKQEIGYREQLGYPPFRRLVRLLFRFQSATKAQSEAERAAALLRHRIETLRLTGTEIIGPAPCFFTRTNRFFRWHLLLRGPDPTVALQGMDMPQGWYADIDPVDVL